MSGRMTCVVLDDFASTALSSADWSVLQERVDVTSVSRHPGSEEELLELIGDAQIVVTIRERIAFPRAVLQRLPRLRLLVSTGMRNNAIDMDAARELGVTVAGTASSLTPPTELTWALILGLARHVVAEDAAVRSGTWQSTVGMDLHGRTLGLLGLGRIGAAVARIGLAFGMDVVSFSENLSEERCAEVGVRRAESLPALLAGSDVVSIHLKLSERTRALIGEDELALMRPSALLINTSRAGIVDQEALLRALEDGSIGGAGLDVYGEEPLPSDDPLRTAPRTLLTPHLGYVTEDNLRTYFTQAVEDIAAFLDGAPVRVLNAERS